MDKSAFVKVIAARDKVVELQAQLAAAQKELETVAADTLVKVANSNSEHTYRKDSIAVKTASDATLGVAFARNTGKATFSEMYISLKFNKQGLAKVVLTEKHRNDDWRSRFSGPTNINKQEFKF